MNAKGVASSFGVHGWGPRGGPGRRPASEREPRFVPPALIYNNKPSLTDSSNVAPHRALACSREVA